VGVGVVADEVAGGVDAANDFGTLATKRPIMKKVARALCRARRSRRASVATSLGPSS
jgi:hypothetical protein